MEDPNLLTPSTHTSRVVEPGVIHQSCTFHNNNDVCNHPGPGEIWKYPIVPFRLVGVKYRLFDPESLLHGLDPESVPVWMIIGEVDHYRPDPILVTDRGLAREIKVPNVRFSQSRFSLDLTVHLHISVPVMGTSYHLQESPIVHGTRFLPRNLQPVRETPRGKNTPTPDLVISPTLH